MATKKRGGLGRGIGALIPQPPAKDVAAQVSEQGGAGAASAGVAAGVAENSAAGQAAALGAGRVRPIDVFFAQDSKQASQSSAAN
ncbi:MAG: hypothetical protein Q4C71_06430, partial [Microbacteriaceae bacterium]|nr:hypothetical protein [Microbacteriaceae bacterium]